MAERDFERASLTLADLLEEPVARIDPDQGHLLASIAISAKRIADAFDKMNEPVLGVMPSEEEMAKRPSNRIAAAMEKIAERLDHSIHYFDAEKAEIRTSGRSFQP